MPDRKTHNEMTKKLFGKTFNKMHMAKDGPVKILGPSHRRVGHKSDINLILAYMTHPEDPLGAYLAGEFHDAVDFYSTRVKKSLNKKH